MATRQPKPPTELDLMRIRMAEVKDEELVTAMHVLDARLVHLNRSKGLKALNEVTQALTILGKANTAREVDRLCRCYFLGG